MSDKPSDSESPDLADAIVEPAEVEVEAADTLPESENHVELPRSNFWRDLIWATPSWLLSMIVHIILLLALAMVYLPVAGDDGPRDLLLATGDDDALEELDDFQDEPLESLDVMSSEALMMESVMQPEAVTMESLDKPTTTVPLDLADFGLAQAPATSLAESVGTMSGGALSGRGEGRERLVRRDGGNDASEKAVSMALVWLAEHQMPDGGWTFDQTLCPSCRGQCRNPGSDAKARNAATAMALLPFLGAGQTHKEGKYKKVVNSGLYFLTHRMQVSPKKGGSFYEPEGRMYSHGLSAIALCEAYAMTRDKGLYQPAQWAINYIAYAQDPIGGGWRYEEHDPGDTSVVGWQVMALKSAHMGYLTINPRTVIGATKFLDSVQAKNGARYGYATPSTKTSTTAIGLLCRMHLGWGHDNPALVDGVKFLSSMGPSPDNNYYNYYATQVLRHYEGEMWTNWNAKMRDQLITTQAKTGHEKGSWYTGGPHAEKGGRLYDTSLSTMILEVYYRHLPIYRKQSTEAEFNLD